MFKMKNWMLILLCALSFSLCLSAKEAKRSNFIGFVDKNKDGINDLFKDANGDGINDYNRLSYPHLFGFRDDNKDGINDIFIDANGDGINDYDTSFVDNNGDGISDNVIDTDDDNRNDITGRIATRFTATSKRIKEHIRIKPREFSIQETDVFIDRGDGFNDLLKDEKRKSLLNFLSRSMDRYLGEKSRRYIASEESSKVSGKSGVVKPKKQISCGTKRVEATSKDINSKEVNKVSKKTK